MFANDFSGNRNYGELCGNPKFIEVNLPKGKELIRPTIIYGKATDTYGKPFENAIVETNHLKTDKITTDQEGNYKICLLPKQEHIDLNIYNETHSAWKTNLKIGQGEVRKLNMTLRPSMDFEGRITAYDNSSQFMIVVQALLIDEKSKIEKVEQATLSEKNGYFNFKNLRPGKYKIRCHLKNSFLYYGGNNPKILTVTKEMQAETVNFVFAPIQKGVLHKFDYLDGITNTGINDIDKYHDGTILFSSSQGLYCYRANRFELFLSEEKLPRFFVTKTLCDTKGGLWLGGEDANLYYYFNDSVYNYCNRTGDEWVRIDHIVKTAKGIFGLRAQNI